MKEWTLRSEILSGWSQEMPTWISGLGEFSKTFGLLHPRTQVLPKLLALL
jgi:hypothetical protein